MISRRQWRSAAAGRWLCALAVGFVFLLPHLVRPYLLGSFASYSPFSATSPSGMVYDETFLYGAEANYTLTRAGAPAYDDTWEHRNAVYPYSLVPTYAEAALAAALGSLKLAHIFIAFLFPFLSAILLISTFSRLGAGTPLAAFLALLLLIVAFSPQTALIDLRIFFAHTSGTLARDSLQASRDPNPGITFPLFLSSLLLLIQSLEVSRPHRKLLSVAAGIAGGLLFFSYIYYAISWTIAIALLCAASLLRPRLVSRFVWLAACTTSPFALAFLAWQHLSRTQGNYLPRAVRIGLYFSHRWEPVGRPPTFLWGAITVFALAAWLRLRRRSAPDTSIPPEKRFPDALFPVLGAAMIGGLVGLNLEVLSGFNLQQAQHYPHMVLQPIGLLLLAALIVMVWPDTPRLRPIALVAWAALLCGASLAQVAAGRDTARFHRLSPQTQSLYTFLNTQTPVGAVISTDNLALSIALPVFTHNSLLYADGSRSSASDEELMERFLLACRLGSVPLDQLRLRLQYPLRTTGIMNDPSYLFEFSAKYQQTRTDSFVRPSLIPGLLDQYQHLDLPAELSRFRIDFIWTDAGHTPPPVPGWQIVPILSNPAGTLWSVHPASS